MDCTKKNYSLMFRFFSVSEAFREYAFDARRFKHGVVKTLFLTEKIYFFLYDLILIRTEQNKTFHKMFRFTTV